jgi:hypothetical protein
MAEIQRLPGLLPMRLGFPESLLRSLVLSPDLLPLGDDGSDSQPANQEEGRQSAQGQPFPPASCSLHSVDQGKGLRISHRLPQSFRRSGR